MTTSPKVRIAILMGAGIVLIILAVSYVYFFAGVAKDPAVIREDKKAALLELVAKAQTSPLTEKQKIEILNAFGGSETANYNFTATEREQILRALNGR